MPHADDPQDKDRPKADPAGRVAHDARGHAIWQWAGSATRQALETTSRMLKRLEVPGLKLLDDETAHNATPEEKARALKAQRLREGFSPYESAPGPKSGARPAPRTAPAKPSPARPAPSRPAPAAKPSVQRPPPRPEPARRSLFSRLFGRNPRR